MQLFVSIVSAISIVFGIIAIIFSERFVLIDEFGTHVGTALGFAFVTGGLSLFMVF